MAYLWSVDADTNFIFDVSMLFQPYTNLRM